MSPLRTNIVLDPVKLLRAKKTTGLKTTRAVVDFALSRLSSSTKGLSAVLDLSGKVHFRKGYSYKKLR